MEETNTFYIKYEKVFIPEIIRIQKDKLENYTFLKTITAGASNGHILQGGNYFYMCLSKDDNITVESKVHEPIGFRRTDVNDLYIMADTFDKVYATDKSRTYNYNKRKFEKVVNVPVWDTGMLWHHRMYQKYLINTVTGEEIHLSEGRTKVFEKTGLTNHTLNSILTTGVEAKNWCYKGDRTDGQTWEQFFENKSTHYKTNQEYIHTCFKKDNSIIYFVNLRTTGTDLGVSPELLRISLVENKSEIAGYQVIKMTPEEYAQKLFWKNQLHQTQP